MDQPLPPDFQARMEDETPVTAHNLLEYLAEYFYYQGLNGKATEAIVGGFLKDRWFRQLCEQENHEAMWEHVFDERNYSKERACFIIDLILVLQIYHQFMKPQMSFIRTINRAFGNQSGEFILCSKVLSMYVDQEKVEICMCLKRYMCYDLWRRIGRHLFPSDVEERTWILHDYKFWIAEHNNLYGGCLERTILGPSKNCFINMLRNAWTKPYNGYYIVDTELNRLYPNASVLWEPPRVFKEPKFVVLQLTH